jgi:hypothetical protein
MGLRPKIQQLGTIPDFADLEGFETSSLSVDRTLRSRLRRARASSECGNKSQRVTEWGVAAE